MNLNFYLVYSIFALLTIVINVFLVIKLGHLLHPKLTEEQKDRYHGISEVTMLFGCGILFFDLFTAVSTTLRAMDMQKIPLFHVDVIKLLISYEAITCGAIGIAFFCSRAVFKVVKNQFKDPLNAISLRLLFGMLFIIMIIASKPVVIELINHFQPTIKTPFFR